MDRVILHSDLNNFFASVECRYDPTLWEKPVAVCGSKEQRHGIVLAKNQPAKLMGVKTGEAIWQAQKKCPELVIVPPHFDRYAKFSAAARAIYESYTDRVESFGIDECWLDVTNCRKSGEEIAEELRSRIKSKLGVTVSVGVSFNKVFAKLGSDMKKPDAVTVISRANFKETVWKLPVTDMLGVGNSMYAQLHRYYIETIGDLANASPELIKRRLGKCGEAIQAYANGLDSSPVALVGESHPARSISSGMTLPHDLTCDSEAKELIYYLSETVAAGVRRQGMRCTEVSVAVKDSRFERITRQRKLPVPIKSTFEIAAAAYSIFTENYSWNRSVRNITVGVSGLVPEDSAVQTDFFSEDKARQRLEALDGAVDKLRSRYGSDCLKRAIVMEFEGLTEKKSFDEGEKL